LKTSNGRTHSKITKSACIRQRNEVELPNGGTIAIDYYIAGSGYVLLEENISEQK
jgi:hypothetical protein